MALMLRHKKDAVDKLMEMASHSTSVIAADFRGLKSSEITELRARLRNSNGSKLKVVRNTLAKKAFKGTVYEALTGHLTGPVALAFIKDEPSIAAKLLRDFSKEKEKLTITALMVEGKLLAGNQLDLVVCLPTKQEAMTKLVVVMQAPIVKFVKTVIEPIAKLTRTLAAVEHSLR